MKTPTITTSITSAIKPAPGAFDKKATKSEKYPFGKLIAPVASKTKDGEPSYSSFGVIGKNAQEMQSVCSLAQNRYGKPKVDDKGKPVLSEKTGKQLTEHVRKFKAVNVDVKSDPDKATVRIFCIA